MIADERSFLTLQVNDGSVLLQPELEAITSEDEFTQNFSAVTDSLPAEGTVFISNGLESKAFQTQVSVNLLRFYYRWICGNP